MSVKTRTSVIHILRLAALALCLATPAKSGEVTIFAAASFGDALADMATDWQADSGHSLRIVLGGSSTLARQIEAGAPADVFLSASADWMDALEADAQIDPATRRDLASNRLVLVVSDPAFAGDAPLAEHTPIAAILGSEGRLAIALPDAVPAGQYGKQGLISLGLWDGVADRLAPTDNVRAALALVALGEAPLGVVYLTDARAEPRVHIAGVFPDGSHDPIRYPAAVVAGSPYAVLALDFLDWAMSGAGQGILARYGFLPPEAAR